MYPRESQMRTFPTSSKYRKSKPKQIYTLPIVVNYFFKFVKNVQASQEWLYYVSSITTHIGKHKNGCIPRSTSQSMWMCFTDRMSIAEVSRLQSEIQDYEWSTLIQVSQHFLPDNWQELMFLTVFSTPRHFIDCYSFPNIIFT